MEEQTQGEAYYASLALLPASFAVGFKSHIQGKPAVAVGRWQPLELQRQQSLSHSFASLSSSSSFQKSDMAHEHALAEKTLMGRTNPAGSLPPALDPWTHVPNGERLVGTIIISDAAPQGLMEGLAQHFPHSEHLGLIAPPTPFETGRDRTLFYDGPADAGQGQQDVHTIFAQGAVGVAIVASPHPEQSLPRVGSAYANLHSMGKSHVLTAAEGNVISLIGKQNAVDVFRKTIESRPIKLPDHQCVFHVGVYRQGQKVCRCLAFHFPFGPSLPSSHFLNIES